MPHRTDDEVVLEGTFIEDRTPGENRAQPMTPAEQAFFAWMAQQGAQYARLPRGLPWFDLFVVAIGVASLASVVWLRFGWPGQAALALILAPIALLGVLRQFAPAAWARWRAWYQVHRVPRTRRLVVVSRGRPQPVGVEIDHPDHWSLPVGGGPVRCHGRWVEEDRLFRADRIVPVDADWQRPTGRTIRSAGYQTFGFALGAVGFMLIIAAVFEGIL